MIKKIALWFCIILFFPFSICSEGILPDIFHKTTLKNGLSVVSLPCYDTPYVTVTAFVRGGAFSQSEEKAGLYRPLGYMFVRKLAAAGFNFSSFSVQQEYIAVSVAIPGAKLKNLAGFLADILFASQFSVTAEDAKNARESAEAELASTETAFYRIAENRLFAKYPWRKDTVGRPDLMEGFSEKDYGEVRKYFVPFNSMIAVSGPLSATEVDSIVIPSFAALEAGNDPLPPLPKAFSKPSISRFQFLMYPDSDIEPGKGKIEIFYRGPGLIEDTKAAQAAFIWRELIEIPAVPFRTNLMREIPKLVSESSIDFGYTPRFDASLVTLAAEFFTDAVDNAADRAQRWFKEQTKGVAFTEFHRSDKYFPDSAFEAAKTRFSSRLKVLADDPASFFSWYAGIWAGSDPIMAPEIIEGVSSVKLVDVRRFVKEYIMSALEVVTVRVNPVDFEREKQPAKERRFEFIQDSYAAWWVK